MRVNGAALRAIRQRDGWSLRGFAANVSVPPSTLSAMERGLIQNPSPAVLKRCAEGLRIPLSAIVESD